MLAATGGLGVYDALWGYGLVNAIRAINQSAWSDGREPYKELVGESYAWSKDDHVFGAHVIQFVPPAHRVTKTEPRGQHAVWLCRDVRVTGGHRVAPLEWDAETQLWKLQASKVLVSPKVDDGVMILSQGPDRPAGDLEEFQRRFNLPNYKVHTFGSEVQKEEGYDPVDEVEAVVGRKGTGKKAKYLVKWVGCEKRSYEPVGHLKGCMELVHAYDSDDMRRG